MFERQDYDHRTPQENINLLFNMVQKCRVELDIMKYRSEYQNKVDSDLVKAAESLYIQIKELFGGED